MGLPLLELVRKQSTSSSTPTSWKVSVSSPNYSQLCKNAVTSSGVFIVVFPLVRTSQLWAPLLWTSHPLRLQNAEGEGPS